MDNGRSLKIEIYDTIGKVFDWDTWSYKGVNFDDVKEQIRDFNGGLIDVYINSEGGDMLIAESIYSLLKGHSATVHTHVVGYAISSATIIAMAGDVVHMADNAWFMIHNPTTGKYGDVNQMQQTTNTLEAFTSKLANDYSRKTGIEVSVIRQMMDDETWMNATDAKDKGFVDELTQGINIAASLYTDNTFRNFQNVPNSVLNLINNKSSLKNQSMTAFEEFKNSVSAKLEAIQNSISNIGGSKKDNGEVVINGLDGLSESFTSFQNSLIDSVEKINTDFENRLTEVTNKLEGINLEELKNLKVEDLAKKGDIVDHSEAFNKVNEGIKNLSTEIGKMAGIENSFKQEATSTPNVPTVISNDGKKNTFTEGSQY